MRWKSCSDRVVGPRDNDPERGLTQFGLWNRPIYAVIFHLSSSSGVLQHWLSVASLPVVYTFGVVATTPYRPANNPHRTASYAFVQRNKATSNNLLGIS